MCEYLKATLTIQSDDALFFLAVTTDEVESVSVSIDITSARVTWTGKSSNTSDLYELQYFPSLFPSHRITLNTTLKFHDVMRLIPTLRYRFQVRVYTGGEHGDWVGVVTSSEKKIRK